MDDHWQRESFAFVFACVAKIDEVVLAGELTSWCRTAFDAFAGMVKEILLTKAKRLLPVKR